MDIFWLHMGFVQVDTKHVVTRGNHVSVASHANHGSLKLPAIANFPPSQLTM
jgi:hypothetical protein